VVLAVIYLGHIKPFYDDDGDIICVTDVGEDTVVAGWEASHTKYLTGVEYHKNNGTFHINHTGVYQVQPVCKSCGQE